MWSASDAAPIQRCLDGRRIMGSDRQRAGPCRREHGYEASRWAQRRKWARATIAGRRPFTTEQRRRADKKPNPEWRMNRRQAIGGPDPSPYGKARQSEPTTAGPPDGGRNGPGRTASGNRASRRTAGAVTKTRGANCRHRSPKNAVTRAAPSAFRTEKRLRAACWRPRAERCATPRPACCLASAEPR